MLKLGYPRGRRENGLSRRANSRLLMKALMKYQVMNTRIVKSGILIKCT
jgi:hypothetical protein